MLSEGEEGKEAAADEEKEGEGEEGKTGPQLQRKGSSSNHTAASALVYLAVDVDLLGCMSHIYLTYLIRYIQ